MSKFQKGNKINLGRHPDKETKEKIKETLKRKGIKPIKPFRWTGLKRKSFSAEQIEKMKESHKGHKHSEMAKEKMKKSHKGLNTWIRGRKYSEKEKIERAKTRPRGEKHSNWKGGITPLVFQIRNCFEYRQWRSDIFTRDNFTCQECEDNKGGNLVAHHIKEFSKIIEKYQIKTLEEALNCEELWNINNGITLCEKCHKLFHKKI